MVFVKVVKNKAYYKRYQVKYRRRREGKTDYRQRKRLITQDKNKYQSPKYRFVVRFSNKQVICQIVYSLVDGDKVLVSASSNELPRYGLKNGLKNYSSSYCTGLLCARRLLHKLNLNEIYIGTKEVNGKIIKTEDNGRQYYVESLDENKRPFHAILDLGIKSTTTGSRAFAAMKGAVDGGLDIPHSENRFAGYDKESKKYNAEEHKNRILGHHVAEYMRHLLEEDSAKYASQFSQYIKEGVNADNIEELYSKVHQNIRADPTAAAKKEQGPFDKSFQKKAKLTLEERKERVKLKKEQFYQKKNAVAIEEEDN